MYDGSMDTASKTPATAKAPVEFPGTRQRAEYARFDAIEAVDGAIDSALAEAEHRILMGTMEAADIISFLRIELGREDARGPHHPAPGIEGFTDSLDLLFGFVKED